MSELSRGAVRLDGPGLTPVGWPLRLWFVVEVAFGLAALATLVRFPAETATRFAWPVEPVVMVAVLAGLYAAMTPVLVLAALTRHWENVRVLVPVAIAFTGAELLATVVHLDRFTVGTLPFWVWLASYLLPPPIFLATWVWQQRRSTTGPGDRPLPRGLRVFLFVAGVLVAAEALVTLAHPPYLTAAFPFALTPLNARVLAGWLLAVGVLLVAVARENDHARVRVAAPLLVLLLPALTVSVAGHADQVDLTHPRIWGNAALLAVLAACGLYLLLARRPAPGTNGTLAR